MKNNILQCEKMADKSVLQLKNEAKDQKIKGYSKMNKAQLCEALGYEKLETPPKPPVNVEAKEETELRRVEIRSEVVSRYPRNGQPKKERWYKNDVLYKQITYHFNKDGNATPHIEQWFNEERKFHRDDNPAYKRYFKDGRLEMEVWYQNGKENRDNDLPASTVYHTEGDKVKLQEEWYFNGKLHRLEKPAFIWYDSNGDICYSLFYSNGVFLRRM